jgi:hypothetical protein
VASVDIFWNGNAGYDIHLLPGETSSSLVDLLVIQEDTTPPRFSFANTPPADVASILFTPNFLGVGPTPVNGGVTVDTSTGKVSVAAAPTLKSFVIEATVTTKPPNPRTLGPIPIRVLVHTAILDIWLTPSTLTIRQGADGLRLTLLARFEDQTIGDITRRPGIAWATSDATQIAVAANGALSALTNPANETITATHVAHVATAQVQAKEPWSIPVAASLVPGSAGVAKAAGVPNILFLAEGFTAPEKPKFEALVRAIVKRLQSTESLRPYDLAKGAANFWMASVPARERGTSAVYDLQPVVRTTLFGAEIPDPVRPADGATYTLENLIYQVGLPTQADAGIGADAARSRWLAQFGVGVPLNVTDAVYAHWQALADHRLANEVDNAFGITNGQRPTMHRRDPPRVMNLNPLRTTRKQLDAFLQKLTVTPGGPTIGAIWATQDPAAPIPDPAGAGLPAGLKVGQDRALVFVVCGGARRGGTQLDGLIVSSLRPETEVRLQQVPGTRQVDFVPYDLPTTPSLEFVAKVAHETSHAFGLQDEYGEFATLRIPATQEVSLTPAGNVQPGSDLERSAADTRLDPAKLGKIKWLWPRIDQAGVLATQPDPQGAGFDVKLVHGHAVGFKRGDLVRLRRRPLVANPQASGRLVVDHVAGDVVTVVPLPGTVIVPGEWPPSSILLRPVRGAATPADPDGPDLPLVAPIISDHLAASSLPLNRTPPPAPAPACAVDTSTVQSALNLPAGLPVGRPRFKAQIVGLYDGGVRYFCGVYHPSGACVMRALKVPGMPLVTYLFCPVCRYFLVDRLDPTKHAVIDRDYRKRYPQP